MSAHAVWTRWIIGIATLILIGIVVGAGLWWWNRDSEETTGWFAPDPIVELLARPGTPGVLRGGTPYQLGVLPEITTLQALRGGQILVPIDTGAEIWLRALADVAGIPVEAGASTLTQEKLNPQAIHLLPARDAAAASVLLAKYRDRIAGLRGAVFPDRSGFAEDLNLLVAASARQGEGKALSPDIPTFSPPSTGDAPGALIVWRISLGDGGNLGGIPEAAVLAHPVTHQILRFLQQFPDARLLIRGGADSSLASQLRAESEILYLETAMQAIDLGKSRAQAFKAALVKDGIEPDRVETEGAGWDLGEGSGALLEIWALFSAGK